MMRITFPKTQDQFEKRIAFFPSQARKYTDLGFNIHIEKNYGQTLHIADAEFEAAGVHVDENRRSLLLDSDLTLVLRTPSPDDAALLKKNSILVGFLDPFSNKELILRLAQQGVSAISMEMIPRITRAQNMDVLSSQASLAGYAAVILAAKALPKIFPMQMTAAGTISPARVLIIGAGVAGLQAIATAKRLGARVEAFDTRPEVAQQIQSLGAKALAIDLGNTSAAANGYAKELSAEQIERQRQAMIKFCSMADVVITTAQVFGKKAPRIITQEMIKSMKPGSVIVDMAVDSGGNVEGSLSSEQTSLNGVTIIGASDLSSQVAVDASLMYSSNIFNFINEFWDKNSKKFDFNLSDNIIKECLVTHQGQITNEKIRQTFDQG